MKPRGDIERKRDVLKALKTEPLSQTRLLSKANMNYDALVRLMLPELEAASLVRRSEDGLYRLTGQGLDALNLIEEGLAKINGEAMFLHNVLQGGASR